MIDGIRTYHPPTLSQYEHLAAIGHVSVDPDDYDYLHSNDYSPDYSQGVNPLDPGIGISWPLPISSISESDRNLPSFPEVKN